MIVVPVALPSVETHQFKGLTIDGREMIIAVEAMADIDESVVLADVRKSVAVGVQVVPDDESGVHPIFVWAAVWTPIGLLMFLAMLLAGMADLISLSYINPSRWPEWLPLIGGKTAEAGLVRLWLIIGPFLGAAVYVDSQES